MEIDVAVIRQERRKAIQVILASGSIYWIPRSCILDGCDIGAGARDILLELRSGACATEIERQEWLLETRQG